MILNIKVWARFHSSVTDRKNGKYARKANGN